MSQVKRRRYIMYVQREQNGKQRLGQPVIPPQKTPFDFYCFDTVS
jgi:hypothetical protein